VTEPNDSAHPVIETEHSVNWDGGGEGFSNTFSTGGLTKREYFAAMVLQGLLTHNDPKHERAVELLTVNAVSIADGLIHALNQEASQ
jgi:hypothetical protein